MTISAKTFTIFLFIGIFFWIPDFAINPTPEKLDEGVSFIADAATPDEAGVIISLAEILPEFIATIVITGFVLYMAFNRSR